MIQKKYTKKQAEQNYQWSVKQLMFYMDYKGLDLDTVYRDDYDEYLDIIDGEIECIEQIEQRRTIRCI